MLASPASLLALGPVVAAVLAFTTWRRRLRLVLCATALLGLAIVFLPTGAWLLRPLENRYAPPDLEGQRVDGILVLGGGIDPVASAEQGRLVLNGAAERMVALLELARQYPQARLAFTGGTASLLYPDEKESAFVPDLLRRNGIDPARLVLESESRNTRENAVFSKRLLQPRPGERWLLVTSAWHVPRAVGCFEAVGWPVTPYPVDAKVGPARIGLTRWLPLSNLLMAELGLREWIGLIAYRLKGYIKTDRQASS